MVQIWHHQWARDRRLVMWKATWLTTDHATQHTGNDNVAKSEQPHSPQDDRQHIDYRLHSLTLILLFMEGCKIFIKFSELRKLGTDDGFEHASIDVVDRSITWVSDVWRVRMKFTQCLYKPKGGGYRLSLRLEWRNRSTNRHRERKMNGNGLASLCRSQIPTLTHPRCEGNQ